MLTRNLSVPLAWSLLGHRRCRKMCVRLATSQAPGRGVAVQAGGQRAPQGPPEDEPWRHRGARRGRTGSEDRAGLARLCPP